jgi:hypothetical protein
VNITIWLNGSEVTSSCLLASTRIAYDSTRRITTASISIMGQALNTAISAYDSAHYDADRYSVQLRELYEVIILDGRDGTTKLFDGQIYAMTLKQSDTPGFPLFYDCELSDWAAWLDRSVCWDTSFSVPMPTSDQTLITSLLGHFCPKITLASIAQIVPTIQSYDWATKTCRQVLDDMCALSQGTWRVDFDGKLYYALASAAPAAPFNLSTSPDNATTFPARIDGYKQDFTNPVNHCYVRGGPDQSTGVTITASYSDPVSIQQYGDYAMGIVDTQIVTGWDASLKAKSTVLQYAYPIETGSFVIWGPDGLQVGMKIHITEENLGIDGDYTIRALTMQWVDAYTVEYTGQFGALQPDLETILRLLNQRTLWATTNKSSAVAGPPAPGSVTDASIASGGLSAQSINSVNVTTLVGQITAGQIQSVNAGQIAGVLSASQIGAVNASVIQGSIVSSQIASVNAGSITGSIAASQIGGVNAATIQGSIQSGQIGSVSATTIQGVVVSSQLANGIIDSLSKFATPLTPVQIVKTAADLPTMPNANFPPNSFFYYKPDGNFYQVTPDGLGWAVNQNPQGSLMSFYNIGEVSASSIVGLIVAAQIGGVNASTIVGQVQANQIVSLTASQITGTLTASQIASVTAGQITGTLAASQIGGVNASTIVGQVSASQIASVNATAIQGTISATQIANIAATQITGTLAYNQIASINASTITIGQLNSNQIASVNGSTINVGSVASDKLNAYSIDVGGNANTPGRVRVYNATGVLIGEIGLLDGVGGGSNYGGWFQLFGAGGTGYSNAKISSDINGNLTITDANLTVNNASTSTKVTINPQTFDSTYSSIAVAVSGGGNSTSVVTRGLVIYNSGGTRVGSIAVSASTGWPVIELPNPSGYIQLDGSTAICRADGGFQCVGTPVINRSGQFIGTGVVMQNYAVSCNGLSIWTGSGWGTGQTVTVFTASPFTIGGVSYSHLIFQGGVLISYG